MTTLHSAPQQTQGTKAEEGWWPALDALQKPAETDTVLSSRPTGNGGTGMLLVDLEEALPVLDYHQRMMSERRRTARLRTYKFPEPPPGSLPTIFRYPHYKQYGFAGRGAVTAWATNPKYDEVHGEVLAQDDVKSSTELPPAKPLEEYPGGPRRKLSKVERELIQAYRMHSYAAEGLPSKITLDAQLIPPHVRRPSVSRAAAITQAALSMSGQNLRSVDLRDEQQAMMTSHLVEEYLTLVDTVHHQRLNQDPSKAENSASAKLAWRHRAEIRDRTCRQQMPWGNFA